MAYIETVNQGNPNTPSSSWPVEVTDGTNVLGTTGNPLPVAGRPQFPVPVQKSKGSNTGAASTTLTVSFGSNVAAGNSLIVFLAIDLATSVSAVATDTLGNNYQSAAIGASNGLQVLSFQTISRAAGSNSVTFTINSSHIMAAVLYEYTGLGDFEVSAANGSANTQNVRISPANGLTVSQDNCLAFMFVASGNATITNDTSAGSIGSLNSDESGTVTGGSVLVAFNCFSGPVGKINIVNSSFFGVANLAPLFEYSLSSGVASEGIVIIFRPSSIGVTGQIQGMYPSGQVIGTNAAENPVLIGALDSSSIIRTLQIETSGADAVSNTANEIIGDSRQSLFNGTSWDRQRGNVDGTLGDTQTISTATTTNGSKQTNFNAKGAIITVVCGTVSGTLPTLQIQLSYSYDGGTTYLTLGGATSSFALVTGNSICLLVYPIASLSTTTGATQTNDLAFPMPRTWRLQYVTTGSGISIVIATTAVQYLF